MIIARPKSRQLGGILEVGLLGLLLLIAILVYSRLPQRPDATPALVRSCMEYLQSNARIGPEDKVHRAQMSIDGKRLTILAWHSSYSTEKFRDRNTRADSCIIRDKHVDIAASQTAFNEEVTPLIESCVTHARGSVPGLNHKMRPLTQEEAGDLRATYCRNIALKERQTALRAEFPER